MPTPAARIAALLDLSVAAGARIGDGITQFDRSTLPYDSYSVALIGKTGKPVAAKMVARTWLCLPQNPLSLLLLDRLLIQPVAGVDDAAAYPGPSMTAPPVKATAP